MPSELAMKVLEKIFGDGSVIPPITSELGYKSVDNKKNMSKRYSFDNLVINSTQDNNMTIHNSNGKLNKGRLSLEELSRL
ncbi:hypothetical protein [Microaceticoccus formicicus]|uniref:hypothetical protein n=1 Tax=Microaceticoccus formicicus TaxID=3118105 RepID=UPI003CD034FD|nr:hypothetical protein VZL98_09120 [Peptoniphilaceae bacterium AMB_02]